METKKVIKFLFPVFYWIKWIDEQSSYSPDFSEFKFNEKTKLYDYLNLNFDYSEKDVI